MYRPKAYFKVIKIDVEEPIFQISHAISIKVLAAKTNHFFNLSCYILIILFFLGIAFYGKRGLTFKYILDVSNVSIGK